MKKWTVIILAALLALVISAAALENEPAAELIEKAQELLLHTDNVTLNVNAEFSLDGVWFKTAEGTWKQDGDRSFRELVLKAPKADGSERRNGYTIVTDAERLYLMEAFTPGVYRNGFTAGRRSILRNTVELNAMFGLAKALASQAGSDLVLGSGAITRIFCTSPRSISFRIAVSVITLLPSPICSRTAATGWVRIYSVAHL